MDDLYSNLDNYNEENTICMLQSENNELKSKLEEYASAMEKLQQDLDKLTSEYKKLELNYSSLLKTAKAEIERKTQMITNLNLEKDKLVLKCYQNTNTFTVHRNRANDKPKAQNCNKDKDNKSEKDIPSAHIETERNEQACVPSNDTTVSSNIDLRSKLLSISNSVSKNKDTRAEKNSDAKENQPKNKTNKSNANFQNRRKSMSAVRLEIDKFSSDDDEIISAGSCKDLSRERTDKRHVDSNFQRSRQSSRISETSSLEDRNSAYHEGSDAYKARRYSRYDDKFDMNRTRDQSSHWYKRYSPDRYGKGSRDYHDSSHSSRKLERNRRKVESPPDDKYRWRKSREPQRSNFGRSHPSHEAEREYRSQEKHVMKHKIKHNYDELDNKRMKLDPQYRQHDGEWRSKNEEDYLEKNYVTETFDFSSCESPDYNHPENPVHQIREIKFTATTKLDDPRISNKKYVLKNNENDGKTALSTAEGRNVEIIPVNKTAWGIKPVCMPEALVRIPQETLHTAKETDREIENPVTNISMESGEIDDDLHCPKDSINDEINLNKLDDVKRTEKTSQKTNSYKIPKLKKTIDNSQISTNTKEIIPLAEPVCEDIIKKSNAKSTKDITSCKKNKPDNFRFLGLNDHSNNELPFLECSDQYYTQKYSTAKEVVVDDLELSDDDTCDNSEQPVHVTKDLREKEVDKLLEMNKGQGLNVEQTSKQNSETREHNLKSNKSENIMKEEKRKRVTPIEPCKGNGKLSKHKKKQKDTLAQGLSKDLTQVSEKTTTKMENEKDIKAACVLGSEKTTKSKEREKKTKTKQVKTKFTELFDDSCSLISPEDLGLAAASMSTAKLPNSVFALEDAQDAADLNVIETVKESEISENLCNIQDNDITNIGIVNNADNIHDTHCKPSIDNTEPELGCTVRHESVAKTSEMHPVINEQPINSIYKNLEPETLEKGKDFVKTVIISSGVQPQIIESERQSASEAEPQIITANKEAPIKALATSTPYKMWQSNEEQAGMEAKPPDTISDSYDSRMEVVEKTQTDNSDTNTLVSQSNCTDAPDVRIFVRRRRKLNKK